MYFRQSQSENQKNFTFHGLLLIVLFTRRSQYAIKTFENLNFGPQRYVRTSLPPRPSAPKVYTPVACTNLLVARYPREASSVPPVTCWRHYRTGRIGVAARSSCLGGVHVGLLLCLGDVLLVPDSFVTKPIVNLELDKIV